MEAVSFMKQNLRSLVSLALLASLLASCAKLSKSDYVSSHQPTSSSSNAQGVFGDEDFIKTDGAKLRKNYGEGDSIVLRGTNAGGYLVIEQWMTALIGSDSTGHLDHKKVTNLFLERFGKNVTLELWEYYRSNYWTDLDFDNLQRMGMNVIRLPFTYMNVDPDYYNVEKIKGQKYNFSLLDEFVSKAAERGIYTILDMHGAYGSQNGQDHSGEIFSTADEVDFYSNEEKKSKTLDLWKAIAEHFKGNPAVAGYDLLNEPGEKAGSTTSKHWDYFDQLYDAIREVDEDHVVIFESCWDGDNLPNPSTYGWENCMYSFHNYSSTSDTTSHMQSMQNKISGVEKMNFNVPCYMGEFNCYNNAASWEQTLSLFNQKGWHWTSWTYKLNRVTDTSYPGWGIYYSRTERVIPDQDDLETIKDKWYMIDTAYEAVEKMTFSNSVTLETIMTKYCTQEV